MLWRLFELPWGKARLGVLERRLVKTSIPATLGSGRATQEAKGGPHNLAEPERGHPATPALRRTTATDSSCVRHLH